MMNMNVMVPLSLGAINYMTIENEADLLLEEIYASTKCFGIEESDVIYYAVVAGWGEHLSDYSKQFGWSEEVYLKLISLQKRMENQRSVNTDKNDLKEIENIFKEMNDLF